MQESRHNTKQLFVKVDSYPVKFAAFLSVKISDIEFAAFPLAQWAEGLAQRLAHGTNV